MKISSCVKRQKCHYILIKKKKAHNNVPCWTKIPFKGNPMLLSIFDRGYAERAMAGRGYFINASEQGMWGFFVHVRGTSYFLFFGIIIFCSNELQRLDNFFNKLPIMTLESIKLLS
jgi:hypothetical protein